MTLPTPLPVVPPSPASAWSKIAATNSAGVINAANSTLGEALLVHEIGGGAAPSGGGVGGSSIGAQVLTAAANAPKVVLGTMLVASGSSISGSVRNASNLPGVMTITDGSGKVLARLPLTADGQPNVFTPRLYPLLANAGAVADANNDVMGNSTLLGQVPIGMQFPNVPPCQHLAPTPGVQIGWGVHDTGSTAGYTINPAAFPFTLKQAYVAVTDSLIGFVWTVSDASGHTSNVYPSMTGDATADLILFDPNGQPVLPAAIRTATSTFNNWFFRAYIPGGSLLPGWWTLVDNGLGNDKTLEGDAFYDLSGGTSVIGGGTAFGFNWMGLYANPPGGGNARVTDSAGNAGYSAAFNFTARMQDQAATSLYRQGIQSLTFTAYFPAAPNGANVIVAAVT